MFGHDHQDEEIAEAHRPPDGGACSWRTTTSAWRVWPRMSRPTSSTSARRRSSRGRTASATPSPAIATKAGGRPACGGPARSTSITGTSATRWERVERGTVAMEGWSFGWLDEAGAICRVVTLRGIGARASPTADHEGSTTWGGNADAGARRGRRPGGHGHAEPPGGAQRHFGRAARAARRRHHRARRPRRRGLHGAHRRRPGLLRRHGPQVPRHRAARGAEGAAARPGAALRHDAAPRHARSSAPSTARR